MDQAPNHPSPDVTVRSTEALSPAQARWEAYYKEASRRRRGVGGGRNLRIEKRRRRLRERLGIAVSALIVGAMTLAFYLVLAHR
jgi:hypothetical protein